MATKRKPKKKEKDAIAKKLNKEMQKGILIGIDNGNEIARLGEDLFKGMGILTMASGDIGVGGGMTALGGIVKPALSGAQAFRATRGISIPSLQNI